MSTNHHDPTHIIPYEAEVALELANVHQDYAKLECILRRSLRTICGAKAKAHQMPESWAIGVVNYQWALITALLDRIENENTRHEYYDWLVGGQSS